MEGGILESKLLTALTSEVSHIVFIRWNPNYLYYYY